MTASTSVSKTSADRKSGQEHINAGAVISVCGVRYNTFFVLPPVKPFDGSYQDTVMSVRRREGKHLFEGVTWSCTFLQAL